MSPAYNVFETRNRDLFKDVVSPYGLACLIRSSIDQFTSASVLVIAFLTMEAMDKYPDEKRRRAEHVMVVQSVAVSIQNLLLPVHTEGLGACWFCSSLFCQGTVRKVLGALEGVEPRALITVGYSGEKPESPARKPFESVIFEAILGGRE